MAAAERSQSLAVAALLSKREAKIAMGLGVVELEPDRLAL